MRLRLFLLCPFSLLLCVQPVPSQTLSKAYTPVPFCDLVKKPSVYDGKRVTVYSTYAYGFEWQELYAMKCRGNGKTWLEYPSDPPKEMKRALRRAPKGQGTLNGRFSGVFEATPGAFGDGGYKFRLVLESVTDVEIISRSGGAPEVLMESERRRLCDGESVER